jgi:dipeptidyl aminopeptidase/acylaminoacyl peptidase
VSVNYGGSTGYGRTYRDLLKGKWGIVDVEDCTEAALYLVRQGLADPKRLAIEGGSSGGFTTLEALCSGTFQVGADHFGVSDPERLALDTHKFESRYLDQLIGPYPAAKAIYEARSPIHHADRIQRPVIIFQGDEDAIVPPTQSEAIYRSLIERKIPTAYLLFQGEQHGFRKAENIQRVLEAQSDFFSKILGFPLSEKIQPVEIINL